MGVDPEPQIAEALKLLWLKFLPQMQERVAVLEEASSALQAGALSAEQRTTGSAAAHKLAGVLGTFGMTEGTNLAREAEQIYASGDILDSVAAVRIAAVTNELADLIRMHR